MSKCRYIDPVSYAKDLELYKKQYEAYIEILGRSQWEWKVTLTFVNGENISQEFAQKMVRRFEHRINRKLFGKSYYKKNPKPGITCFFSFERNSSEGMHCHGLVFGVKEKISYDTALDIWHKFTNAHKNQIEEFDPKRGWIDYICKQIRDFGTAPYFSDNFKF